MQSAATFFLDDLETRTTITSMTAFRTDVIAAFERFLARVSTWTNLFGARCLRALLAARTRSGQTVRAWAALGMAFCLAFVPAAVVHFVAQFVAGPNQTVAIPFLLTIAAHATLYTFLRARRTSVPFVAWLTTHVHSARQHLRALKHRFGNELKYRFGAKMPEGAHLIRTFPQFLNATNGPWLRLTAFARNVHHLCARRTRSRMTEQNALMATLQGLAAHISA